MERIDSLKLKKMSGTNLFNESLARAMSLCSGREYCSGDITGKLQAWGLNQEEINKILEVLVREKFIDDARYASSFVKDKFNLGKWGKVKISAHLRARNLPGEIIRNALDHIDEETYRITITDLLTKQKKNIRAGSKYDLKGKLYRFGVSKGYESGLVYEIINEIC